MTITVAQAEAEYAEQLGRCEVGGELIHEDELFEVNGVLTCEKHYVDPR